MTEQAKPTVVEALSAVMADCILWSGAKSSNGYGQTTRNGRQVGAHRAAYEDAYGPIPAAHHVHHICRRRACVNPLHLLSVDPYDHEKLDEGRNSAKTHCKYGHLLDDANTYYRRDRPGQRQCRNCVRDATRRYRAKKRMAA